LVFQDYALFPHLTVAQNVGYGMRQRRIRREEIPDRVAAMLRLVRLEGFDSRRPTSLSGGQQQRVALARALATNPSLVLLDEPLSALDAKLRQELRSELKEILSLAGATTIVVTHDQEEAMSLAEHVIVMADGEILQQAEPSAIYRAPASKSVATFIGRSNWFDGVVVRMIDGGLCEFQCAEGTFIVAAPEKSGTACGLNIRPERLVLISQEDSAASANRLEGKVSDVIHLGAEIHVPITLASGYRVLVVQQDRGQALPCRGDDVLLSFRPADGCVVPV
jgi:ABC-type Fe3+/spermidine/putrescine transport system ATPase subunit